MMSKVMGLQTVAPHLFLYLNSSPSYAYMNAHVALHYLNNFSG